MPKYQSPSLDGNHDLHLDDAGNLVMAVDAEAVGQHVKQRLKFFQGEWPFDMTAGVPWLQFVFGRPYNPALSEALVRSEVTSTDGVERIISMDVREDRSTRGIDYRELRIQTEFGDQPQDVFS